MVNLETTNLTEPQLGLVCITTSPLVRFRTMTRKRLLQLSVAEQEKALLQLYLDNLARFRAAIEFCSNHQIYLYRLSAHLFPFADEPIGEAILASLGEQLRTEGHRAIDLGIRLVVHPSQFVVLSSDRQSVIENSIKILQSQALILDYLGLARSPWAAINIHGGKSGRSERLISVIKDLPDTIRTRLTLENDEYAYSATEILAVCEAASVPMVFDAHHHLIHEQLDSYDHPSVGEMLSASRQTWHPPHWQLVHISNGRESLHDQAHSDFITTMPASYVHAPWIEVEAKSKEQAIEKLRKEWQVLN